MARSVTIASGKNNVLLPDGGTYNDGDTVVLTDAQFDEIRDALIPGTIIDNGATGELGDAVVTQAATVAAPAALTATAAAGAAPTAAEFDALLADVTALRTTVAAILTALKGAGKPMASA